MATKARAAKKGPEKTGDPKPHEEGTLEKNGKKEAPKEAAGPAVKKKVTQVKEMFPNHNLSEKILADSIKAVGSTHTVDLVMSGQLQSNVWQTVEKKPLERKKEEAEVAAKGAGGRGTGRGNGQGGRGRAFEQGRPAAMRPYSNPRPVQQEKTEGVGGLVKTFAPVSVATTTTRTGLSFAEMLKKSTAQPAAPPAPVAQAPSPTLPEREIVAAPKAPEPPTAAHVPPTPPPSAAAWTAPGVWGQKAREEAARNAKQVQQPVAAAPPPPPQEEEVPRHVQEEPQTQEHEEPVQEEEEPQTEEEEPEPEPEPPAEEEVVEEPMVEPPAPVAPVIPVQPRQATAYRPPPPAAPVPAAEKAEAHGHVVPAAAPKKPAQRAIPQFSSDVAVVLPSHLQSKADHGFKFEAPEDDEEEDEPAPAVVAAEQVVAEPLSSSQDVQTDPYMWEAHREAAVQAMLPPVAAAPAAESPSIQPIQVASAPAPPLVPTTQPVVAPPAVSAPVPPTTSPSLPVQPPVVAAANMMHPTSSASPLSALSAPAPQQTQAQTSPQPPPYHPQQHAAPSPPQPTPSTDEASYMGGASGSDMYFAGAPPSPPQPQQYSPPPFPGMDQMGYPEPFGAYGAYGRKFPQQMPHQHQQQQQQQQQPPAPTASPSSGQDVKAPGPGRPGPPGPAAYNKPAGQPTQATPPPMPAYGMPPYGMPPYGMYGMYGMYGGMQGMPPQGYDAEGGYSSPGFDANKFNMAAAYYANPGYPPPAYNMPPYTPQMRPPWGGYGPAMPQGGPQDVQQKYPQASSSSPLGMGQNKPAAAPPALNNPANKFNNQPRSRGFGNQGYPPQRYDQPQPHYSAYYPPQTGGGYNAFYQHQPHPHQPGPQ